MKRFLRFSALIVFSVFCLMFQLCCFIFMSCFVPLLPGEDKFARINEVHLHRLVLEDSIESKYNYYWMDVCVEPIKGRARFLMLGERAERGLTSEVKTIEAYKSDDAPVMALGGMKNELYRTQRSFLLKEGELLVGRKESEDVLSKEYLFESYGKLDDIIFDINCSYSHPWNPEDSWVLRTSDHDEINFWCFIFKTVIV